MVATRSVVLCVQCGLGANPEASTTARKVIGWVTPRQAGGTNHLRYWTELGEYAHLACLAEVEVPAQALQGSLLGEI